MIEIVLNGNHGRIFGDLPRDTMLSLDERQRIYESESDFKYRMGKNEHRSR